MSNLSKARKIRNIFDNKLDIDRITESAEGVDQSSIKIFQKLFVEILNFDVVTGGVGGIAEEVSTEDWSKSTNSKKAYFIAESMDFRIFYVNLEKLTRTSEKHAVSSMRSKGWIREKEFIAIFHSDDSDVWHLVSPYVEEGEGRTILRRYVVGKGETHRTVSQNLSEMDASKPETLYERVQDAFKLQPVTKEFYEDYKSNYSDLYTHFTDNGMDLREAKRYAHLILNRFMFLYFLQKKRWLNGDKNFINWFYSQYKKSDDGNCFHKKWLNELFFKAMNDREIDEDLPDEIIEILKEFPFLNGGLFAEKEFEEEGIPEDAYLTDEMAGQVITSFLDEYNFTVTEESPVDKDVAVDPAMLGKIYESLIAEEERGKIGIFYTPRIEVDLMCKLALYEYVVNKAKEPDEKTKNEIIKFIFTPLEDWEMKDEGDISKLMDILHNAKIVDPACGSGAFLVGMMQVFSDLYRKLGKEPDYKFREQIVHENLHGVDIKDWAVRMAEFRLWLALVESEEELPEVEPVLPNFDFELKTGDSIVQKVGDEYIDLDQMIKKGGNDVEEMKKELENLKELHYKGESDLEDKIKKKQKEMIKEHFRTKRDKLEDKKRDKQVTLSGNITDEEKQNEEEIEKEIEKIKSTIEGIEKADQKSLFVWGIDFPEVMIDGGFDVVIANPPYVNYRKIIKQNIYSEQKEKLSNKKVRKLKKEYKNDLVSYVKRNFGIKASRRSDLYIYFFFKGLELLNDDGSLVFISSNSWLDVNYGKYLQEYLCKYVPIKGIYNNKYFRSFEEADVNTIICVLGAPVHDKKNFDKKYISKNVWPCTSHSAKFVNFYKPYIKVNNQYNIYDLVNNKNYDENVNMGNLDLILNKNEYFRSVKVKQRDLLEDGWSYPDKYEGKKFQRGKYESNKWGGKFFRAPDIFYKIIDKAENELIELGNYKIETYLNTGGANNFFFVKQLEDLGNGLVKIKNTNHEKKFLVEKKYIKPLIKSPTQVDHIKITKKDTGNLRIVSIPPEDDITDKKINNYVKFGEIEGYNKRRGPSRKNPWYDLPKQGKEAVKVLLPQNYSQKHTVFYNPEDILSNRFYRLHTENPKKIACVLNSTFSSLLMEIFGRANLGLGALDMKKPDYKRMYILDPTKISNDLEIENFMNRKIYSIFNEIGIDKDLPIEEQEPDPLTNRKKLDEMIFDILGLTEDERKEVYIAVADLVKTRLKKADSV